MTASGWSPDRLPDVDRDVNSIVCDIDGTKRLVVVLMAENGDVEGVWPYEPFGVAFTIPPERLREFLAERAAAGDDGPAPEWADDVLR